MKKMYRSIIILFVLTLMIFLLAVVLKETYGNKQVRVYFSVNRSSCAAVTEFVLDNVPADGEYYLRREKDDYVLLKKGDDGAEPIIIPSDMNIPVKNLKQAFRDLTGTDGPHRIRVSDGNVIYYEEPDGGKLIYSSGGKPDRKQGLTRKYQRLLRLDDHWYAVRHILQ